MQQLDPYKDTRTKMHKCSLNLMKRNNCNIYLKNYECPKFHLTALKPTI